MLEVRVKKHVEQTLELEFSNGQEKRGKCISIRESEQSLDFKRSKENNHRHSRNTQKERYCDGVHIA